MCSAPISLFTLIFNFMKRFILKILLFFAIIFAFDIIVGIACSYMQANAKGGDNGRNNFICNEVNSDILVFGSSRAVHHYNPIILSNIIGASCYNCGQDGNGSILSYGRLRMIIERYHPQLIIYDIMPSYDLLSGDDNHKYLGWLKAYYDRREISEIFERIDPMEKYKMMSQMYRYNTKFIQILSDYLHPIQSEGINGYKPLKGKMNLMKTTTRNNSSEYIFDKIKITFLERLIDISKPSNIIFVVSPNWNGMDTLQFEPIKRICEKNGYVFWDFSNSPKYLYNNQYFKDGCHMNEEGADEFSYDIAKKIKYSL